MPASPSAPLAGLRDLLAVVRRKLRVAIATVVLAWVVAYLMVERIVGVLAAPLEAALARQSAGRPPGATATALNYGSLAEPFWTHLSLSFWVAIAAASPVLFFQLWRAIAPRLPADKRRLGIPFAGVTAAFFVGGIVFGYVVVLPEAFDFFLSYSGDGTVPLTPALFIQPYVQLVSRMLVAFGVAFELPIVLALLAWLGVVGHRALWRFNRYAVVIAFVVAAVLTPGPDPLSQVFLAIPLVVLYNAAIAFAWALDRRRQQRASQPSR